jgi:hypothetical protein
MRLGRGFATLLPGLLTAVSFAWAAPPTLSFPVGGHTNQGDWSGNVKISPAAWKPGDTVNIDATLKITARHLQNLAAAGIKPDSFILLLTAERTFDYGGHLRRPFDHAMSTLITPTGLPIEGGPQGAVTTRFGNPWKTPLDEFLKVPASVLGLMPGDGTVFFHSNTQLPANLPPGIYRLRMDYGVAVGTRNYGLNGDSFAAMLFFRGTAPQAYVYSPLIPADGTAANGDRITAAAIKPRIPWVLLYDYISNGYRGVVADEDKPYFAISSRNLIQDDVILARYDANNKPVSYTLEPSFLADNIDACWNIPWDWASGEIAVSVTNPDGSTVSLGQYPFLRQSGLKPTTAKSAITAWVPPAYGQYTVKAAGWIRDIYGNRYEGGGTYRFWIAKRMTMATATFQGMPYPVGGIYGRDIGFAPAVPADVTVTATLFPDSDPAKAVTMTWGGKANNGGVFGALQGNKSLPLSAQGEYLGHVLATYTDGDGHLWVCSMRHAGVVFDPNGPIVARGKKVLLPNNQYAERGHTNDEGWIDSNTDNQHLIHLNFPYNPGDVLLIASDGQGANKIIPTITYETKVNPQRSDSTLNSIGATNIQLKTSNGYSPHMFPEYITDWAYYYGSAARPGFMGRFLVGEHMVRAPYWSVSPNSFGGQIAASTNGDMPGEIYRLLGGVVLRQAGQAPMYAGYVASSFLLPKGQNDNRVIAPGSEEITGATGQKSRVFLVGPRPGMAYPVGTTFGAALQIDPILPTEITFKLKFPDGHEVETSGVSDAYGSFSGKDRWVLDTPGIYTYRIQANWNGNPAIMPGLPPTGGYIYVTEAQPPANAPGIRILTADGAAIDPVTGVHIIGLSTADKVKYAAVMPGAVLDQGELTVTRGQFDYYLNPAEMHNRAEVFDVTNRTTGKPELGDVIHLSLFSEEKTPEGQVYHSFQRVIIRGNQVRVAK